MKYSSPKSYDSLQPTARELRKKDTMEEVSFLNPMDFYPRFSLIGDQIFQQMDKKSLANCREVAKSWQKSIDNRNLSWRQIIHIPKIWEANVNTTYLHLAAAIGQSEPFEKVLKKEEIKNPKNTSGFTPFYVACWFGHVKIAEILLKEPADSIDLDAKDCYLKQLFKLPVKMVI